MRTKLAPKKSSTEMESNASNSKSEVLKTSKETATNPKRRQRLVKSTSGKSVLSEINSMGSDRKITLKIRRDETVVKMVDVAVGDYAMVGTIDRGVGDGIIEPEWLPEFPVTVFHEDCNSESSNEEWNCLQFPRKSYLKENSKPEKQKHKAKAAEKKKAIDVQSKLRKRKTPKEKLKPDTENEGAEESQQVSKKKSEPGPVDDFPKVKKMKGFNPIMNCEICGKLYRKYHMPRHMKTHQKEKPHSCKKCGKSFSRSDYCKQHIQQCVENPAAFQCEICHRNLATKSCLMEHVRLHSEEKLFQCHICVKSFRQYTALANHIKTHSDQRSYSCDICDKTYKSKGGLETHKTKIHQGIYKRFHCDQCEKSFLSVTLLKDHINKHMGVTRHKCEHCGKGFFTRKNLVKHMLIHQDKKPFPCKVCGKAFRQNNDLKRHTTTHTGVKPFRCEACGKQFIHRVYLVRHKCSKTNDPGTERDLNLAEKQSSTVEIQNNALTDNNQIMNIQNVAMPVMFSDHAMMHSLTTSHDIIHPPYLLH